jgi:hypothetical protein
MVEKDFVEEFFLQTIRAKKAKEERRKRRKSKKKEEQIKEREKEEAEKIREKISAKEFKPIIAPRVLPEKQPQEAEETEAEKEMPAIIPASTEQIIDIEVPEPPTHLIEMPEPPLPPPDVMLPTPPKFFEPGIGVKPVVDLGKLNSLITDPTVESIQCDGSFMPVKIVRNDQEVNTQIELDDRDINEIINKFAQASQKQVQGPVFKATIHGLTISAVISEFAGTKFIITKR